MSVQAVGFDVGSLNSFVSYVTRQGIQTVHNEYGDRRIPTCLCFLKGRRLVGMAAKQQHERIKATTIWNFVPILGKQFNMLTLEERHSFPFVCQETIGGRVGVEVNHLDRIWTLTPEQLLAAQLQHLRTVTERATSNVVKSVVISVPVYYNSAQRRAVRDAAHVAGISCAKLVNDTTAIATVYGFCRDGIQHVSDPPHHVAIVSIGYRNTQVAICAISKGVTRILATAYDAHLGGQDFDQILFDTFRQALEKKHNIRLEPGHGLFTRLLKECEQLKIRMSTNSSPLSICLDGLIQGKSVQFSMKRNDFAVLCDALLVRFRETLLRCLSASKLKPSDIQAVELVGGSCRIPALRTIAALVFDREATTTLNADEAVARGCAIQAAMCSANFEVRYRVIEPDVRSDTRLTGIPAFTVKDLNVLRAAELHMSQWDQEHSKRSMARNTLEEYVYATRDRFEGPLRQTVTDEERRLLDETEALVGVDASELDSEVYHDRLAELREVVARAEKRRRLAKSDALMITTIDRRPTVQQVHRPSKYDQIRRSQRHKISAPISSYVPVRDFTQPLKVSAQKPAESLTLDITEKVRPINDRLTNAPLRTIFTPKPPVEEGSRKTPERLKSEPIHEIYVPKVSQGVAKQMQIKTPERLQSEPIQEFHKPKAMQEAPEQIPERLRCEPIQDVYRPKAAQDVPKQVQIEVPERLKSEPIQVVYPAKVVQEGPKQKHERRKSEPIQEVFKPIFVEEVQKPKFVRSATMERKHVTGQLNCYNTQRKNSVNSIVSFFEKINDVNVQEAQKLHSPRRSLSPERASSLQRTLTHPEYSVIDTVESRRQPITRSKSFHLDQRQMHSYPITSSFEKIKAPGVVLSDVPIGPPLDPATIKATAIVSQLKDEPQVPSYDQVVDSYTSQGIQFRLLDAIQHYRSTISVESRRLYEVLDRYQMYLRRQIQMGEASHGLEMSKTEVEQIETEIAEAKRVMDEVHHHQTDTAQHLSFLDRHRDTMLALASANGSGPQYTQQAYVRILDTFVQPILSMMQQAKVLWTVLQEYETWLSQGVRDRFVQTNWLSPSTRFEDRVINQVNVYKVFVWQQVSCLNNQLHHCLEHMKQQIEKHIQEDRCARTMLSFVPPPR